MRTNSVCAVVVTVLFLASVVSAAGTPSSRKKKLTLQDLLSATSGKSSKRPATVAGVRGLDETDGSIDTQARDYAAVGRMEQVKVRDEELARFIKEGALK